MHPLPKLKQPRLTLGVSACLMGRPVRFNGGHCRNGFLLDEVAPLADLVEVCPEMGVGMGAPRETIRQEAGPNGLIQLRAPKSGTDWTEPLTTYSNAKARELAGLGLDGFILKKDSPTCGLQRVKVYNQAGMAEKTGAGVFARALRAEMPLLPIEEEGRLHDARIRENFFERAYAHHRLREFFVSEWSRGDLVRFHTAEKLLLMSHDPSLYGELGRLVGRVAEIGREQMAKQYCETFMQALETKASLKRQTNVLQHVVGYFKETLDASEKAELLGLIDDFRRGLTPLAAPMALVKHHVARNGVNYIAGQTYLEPHPKQLRLRAVLPG